MTITNQREKAYQKISNAINSGELKPGERLIEEKICRMMNVGRTPLREALRQLQMEGIVDVLPNKGAIISKISVQDLENIYDIIAVLEGYAMEMGVQYVKKQDRKELAHIQRDLERAGRIKDYTKWIENNVLFHGYLPKLSGNHHLYEVVKGLRNRVYPYRFIAITIPNHIEEYIHAHEEILQAISEKEAKRAGAIMRKHVLFVKKILSDFLRKSPGF